MRILGAGILVAIGLIHLVLAPQYYPAAAYVGLLFYGTCAGAWATALAIIVGIRGAWLLGGLIAVSAFVSLLLASTVGLPGFVDSLSAPWAMLSLMLEGAFVLVYVGLVVMRGGLLLTARHTRGAR